MNRPSVAFVIPCFNHGRFIDDAVSSCLRQQDADVRVVIVNDGSDDDTSAARCDSVAAAANAGGTERVRVLHQDNRGLAAARNRGAAESGRWADAWTSEYLTFLDADDWVEPAFVSSLHRRILLDREPGQDGDISHAYCREKLVELGSGTWDVPDWDPLLMLVTNLHPVTTLVRRERFDAVGGFDETMRHGYEDWDLWIRFVERGWRGVRVPEPLFIWRRHSHQTMIADAVSRHRELFAHIYRSHIELYRRHAEDVIHLSNTLLRRADANWLDENLDAIPIRDLRRWSERLRADRDQAQGERAFLRTRLDDEARLSTERRAALERTAQTLQARAMAAEAAARAAQEESQGLSAALDGLEARLAELDKRLVLTELAREQSARHAASAVMRVTELESKLHAVRASFERKPAIRMSRRLHSMLESMPRPLAAPMVSVVRWVKRPFAHGV